jgi:hypothetical protein
MYRYILDFDFSNSGFHGSHAMLQTGPAQANIMMEQGEEDHNPCEEDEEFFEGRPDTEDMGEAILDGVEQQEHTGFDNLHKVLQGLPVPVQKNGISMKQASALEGGFLRDLDEEEKKRFTPSELVIYKHAVEYRYVPVHNCTYKYITVHHSTY